MRFLTGPDVSEYQGPVNWTKVRKLHGLAIVRVADGNRLDVRWSPERVRVLRRLRFHFLPYYFARVASASNSQRTPREEAKMVVSFARAAGWGKKGDFPLVYDFETTNGQALQRAARHLVGFLRAYKRLTGHRCFIYTMPGYWVHIFPHLGWRERRLVRKHALHIAHWGVSRPAIPKPWRRGILWQHTDHGECPGVSGPVDMNVSMISSRKLDRYRIKRDLEQGQR